jgi:hypothetical protein
MVHRVDVALLGQHRLTIGRHQQRAKRVSPHGGGALRHLVGSAKVAVNLIGVHGGCLMIGVRLDSARLMHSNRQAGSLKAATSAAKF